ncbi:MAG TPA: thioredoxin [Vicinamibacterales bacterium]|nr:thioredoxin [Vicinamibacterales bacterium]
MKVDNHGVLMRCPSCDKTNRLRYPHLNRPTRCANCRTMLPAPARPVEAPDAASFDSMLQQSPVAIVVDFWAPWCGPCRMMAPQFETAARNLAGRALAVKVDTDAVPELSERFRILSIPTLMIFRDGREVSRVSGVQSSADIESLVAQADAHVGGR